MATLDLQVQKTAATGVTFPGTVRIAGGPPGAVVSVTLEQPKGLGYSDTRPATLDGTGAGDLAFDVLLGGKGFKTLVAHATDAANTFYKPDAETVEAL